MPIDPKALEQLSRDELIGKARELGAIRPELLTRPELRDEIIRLSTCDVAEQRQARGWFGAARDLVASVVSQGLNLPDTADLIRGVNLKMPKAGPPVATVTLAEIYAAQGHVSKALTLLDQVLAKEPDHEAARIARQRYTPVAAHAIPIMPPEVESEVEDEVLAGEALQGEQSVAEVPLEFVQPVSLAPATEQNSNDFLVVDAGSVSSAHEPAPFRDEEERTTPVGSSLAELTGTGLSEWAQSQLVVGEIEEDLLLVLHHGGKAPDCLWQLGRHSKVLALAKDPDVKLTIKVLEVEAGWDGPVCRESMLELEGVKGQRSLPVTASEFRLVLGWLKGERFIPLCLGVEFTWDKDTGTRLLWAPPVSQSDEAWERLGRQHLLALLR